MSRYFLFSFVFVPLLVRSVQVCPIYSCDNTVATNTCAAYVGAGAFKINSNGCGNGYTCSAVGTSAWASEVYSSGLSAGGTYLACMEVTTTSSETVGTFQSLVCLTKQPNKSFQSGQTVVTCEEDSDCLLTDGTKTVCSCSFRSDGLGICTPSYSNEQLFQGYWDDCGSTNVITDEASALYWTAYMSNWIYEQSSIACADVFEENQTVKSLFDDYNQGTALILTAIWLL